MSILFVSIFLGRSEEKLFLFKESKRVNLLLLWISRVYQSTSLGARCHGEEGVPTKTVPNYIEREGGRGGSMGYIIVTQ